MISLCMIARNEEAFLEACLEAARPAVDEIILVDTGSIDGTCDIARRYDAKIFPVPWRDDFSAPRNEALDRAGGDWVLMLDADELLDRSAPAMIRRAVAEDRHSGFYLPLVSTTDEGKKVECLMVRLFVNRPEIRFRYLIHEQILTDLNHYARREGKPVGILRSIIHHRGYHSQVVQEKKKHERNQRIFQKQLALFPRDVYSWYKYADFLRISGAPDAERLETLKHAWQLLEEVPASKVGAFSFSGEVAALLAFELFTQENNAMEALNILRQGERRYAPTPHLYYFKAEVERSLGQFQDALSSYECCLRLAGKDFFVPVTEGVTTWRAHLGMGLCHLELKQFDPARHFLQKSIECNEDQREAYAALAEVAYVTGDLEGALAWLNKLLHFRPDDQEAWEVVASIQERIM